MFETGGNGTSSVHRFRYCVKFYSSEPGTNLHEEITRYQVWPLTHVFSLLFASLLFLMENGMVKTKQQYLGTWALSLKRSICLFPRSSHTKLPIISLVTIPAHYQFFLQLKRDILSGDLPGPDETLVTLAALALQCKYLLYLCKNPKNDIRFTVLWSRSMRK